MSDPQSDLAPIALFVYSRPDHARRALESILANPEAERSPLTIYCDGPRAERDRKGVEETRRVVHQLAPQQAQVIERRHNLGLASSIISGVTEQCRLHGKVIVVEDDLILSPLALGFLNSALVRYRDEPRVMHISAYMFPTGHPLPESFFYREATCWGWATWERAWSAFEPNPAVIQQHVRSRGLIHEFDVRGSIPFWEMLENQRLGKIDSWAIRWYGSLFMQQGLALHPGRSLVQNGGFDGTGVHCNATSEYDVELADTLPTLTDTIEESAAAIEAMIDYRPTPSSAPRATPLLRTLQGWRSTLCAREPREATLYRALCDAFEALLTAAEITPVLSDVGCSGARHAVWDPIAASSLLIAFDPDSRDVPEGLANHYRKVLMVDRAVTESDEEEQVDFVLTRSPYCSSMLDPDLEALGDYAFRDLFIPDSRVSVRATSLNRVLSEHQLPAIDWLKLDSQGTDLRIIRSLHPEAFSGMMALDVEPGLIDAYLGEELFPEVHTHLTRSGFWLSDLQLQSYPRLKPESVAPFRTLCQQIGVPTEQGFLKGSPTAAEGRYLRTLDPQREPRAQILLFVFAILDGQFGFASDALDQYRSTRGESAIAERMQNTLIAAMRLHKERQQRRRHPLRRAATAGKALLYRIINRLR